MSRQERSITKHVREHARRLEQKQITKQKEQTRQPPREHIDAERWDEDEDEPHKRSFKPAPPSVEEVELTAGQVIGLGPGVCKVLSQERIIVCRAELEVVVGDRVGFTPQHQVRRILPRSTTLSRPDPGNPNIERIIAANVEVVVIVVSVSAPALRPGLIARYLIAIEKGGASPILCVNKSDLIQSAADLVPLEPYRALGFPLFQCSVQSGDGIAEVRDALAGKFCVLVGHSGVGKSSLLNALAPGVNAVTGKISEAHLKGRHTTTSSRLYRLENGARIIDTPGIREFGLWDLRPGELRAYFHEFDAYAGRCTYSDCSHTHEPGCAVRAAVDAGSIAEARYSTYRNLLGSFAEE
ncbi:MAG: ribosome small subunit-dependent GTPase A [Acidobacteriota bacterium]|nr:ribosome small subunit-dependent GTPase A [Acidobacteriota bacterium]